MKRSEPLFDWNRARAFLATAETGSYTAAAKTLGLSQSTLSRQVDSFERELGVALFEKAGRGLALTPTAKSLLQHVRSMHEAANAMSLYVGRHAESIEGSVSISATEVMATHVLCPMLKELSLKAPKLKVEVIASNQASDLRMREADIAIRNFETKDEELIARRLPDGIAHLYASNQYLERQEKPLSSNVSQQTFIGFAENKPYIDGLKEAGLDVNEEQFSFVTASHLVHWEMVKAGLAIGVMPNMVGANEPDISRAFPSMLPMPFETWLVVHRELRTNKKVRLVYDFLFEELQSLLLEWQE